MAARTVEREVKFDVAPEFALPDLRGVVDDASQTELPRAELAATYFDTPDRRLLARGITLRHRRDRADPSDPGQWTLKLPARTGGLALERTELTWPGELIAPARRRTRADDELSSWVRSRSDELWLSVISAAEIEDGIAKAFRTGATKKAADLTEWWGEVRHSPSAASCLWISPSRARPGG